MIQDRNRPEVSLEPPPVRWWKRLLRILAAVVIVLIGIAGATYFQKTAPKAHKRPPASMAPLVRVQPLIRQSEQVVVKGAFTLKAEMTKGVGGHEHVH